MACADCTLTQLGRNLGMANVLPETRRSLPIALLRARERVMGPIRAMLTDVGVTEQQWRVLRVLEESGSMEPTRIAAESCLLLPSLTRILQKLEEKQLILRSPDESDRRKQVIRIAPNGKALIDANRARSQLIAEETRNRMGHADYERLLDLLNALDRPDD